MYTTLILFAACMAVLALIGVAITSLPSRIVNGWSARVSERRGELLVAGSPWPQSLAPQPVAQPSEEPTIGVTTTVAIKPGIETYFQNGEWKNKVQGSSRAANRHPTKAAAVKAGREMAQKRKVEHVVKKKDGSIGEVHTYAAVVGDG